MKKYSFANSITVFCLAALLLAGCSSPNPNGISAEGESMSSGPESASGALKDISETQTENLTQSSEGLFSSKDLDTSWDTSDSVSVVFSDGEAKIAGTNGSAAFREGTLTISKAGTYILSGSLKGSVIVEASKNDFVHLVLNGIEITCENSAPINIRQADKAVITLADSTENKLTDSTEYQYDDPDAEEPSAALFSKDDLSLNGNGSLTIQANHNNGIQSKDDLRISGGSYFITAAKNGIVGKDSLVISNGSFTISSENDAMKSTNDKDEGKGYLIIQGGDYLITSESDGIQAETSLSITGGNFEITTAGGSGNSSSSGKGMWGSAVSSENEVSAKGIKAGQLIQISGGEYLLNTSDDSVHSNGSIEITGGDFQISSGDDGVHADELLTMKDGKMNISQSYEGLEALDIDLEGGTVYISASDDGINAAGGKDNSSMGGRPGQNSFSGSMGSLSISGGYYFVDANGDGLDANGTIDMSGGTVLVNGPEDNGNGVLDYDSSFHISGGVLIAAGSSGMAQAASSESTQNAVMYYLPSTESGTAVRLEKADGTEICSFTPFKKFNCILISSPELVQGDYTIKSGGNIVNADSVKDGLSIGGNYEAEATSVSFSLEDSVTYLDSNGVTQAKGFGGFGGGRGHGGMGMPPDGSFEGKQRKDGMPSGEMPAPPTGEQPPQP